MCGGCEVTKGTGGDVSRARAGRGGGFEVSGSWRPRATRAQAAAPPLAAASATAGVPGAGLYRHPYRHWQRRQLLGLAPLRASLRSAEPESGR